MPVRTFRDPFTLEDILSSVDRGEALVLDSFCGATYYVGAHYGGEGDLYWVSDGSRDRNVVHRVAESNFVGRKFTLRKWKPDNRQWPYYEEVVVDKTVGA